MHRRLVSKALLAVTVGALLLGGCNAGSGATGNETPGTDPGSGPTPPSSSGEPADGGDTDHIAIGFVAEPVSLDFTTDDGAAIPQALLVNVYEGLVKLDADGEIVPALASSWEVSSDRKTYTFTLHEGVTFSNGAPFTAEEAAFSINRVKTDWTTSLKKGMEVVQSAKALDPTTLEVTLKRPSNAWLYTMTTRVGAMFTPTGVDDLANKPVGTGPYELTEWRRGDRITLTARDDYWGDPPQIKTVDLRYFKDPSAMNSAMLTGDIDVISTVQTPESIDQFKDESRFRIIEGTTNGEVVLSFNHESPPLDDVRVRRAICYALDRQAILDIAWAGYGTLIGSMVAPTDPWYEDLSETYPYDPERARKLLADAGVEDLTLGLRIPNLPYAVASAQVVKSQLAKVGVTAEIDTLEFPARWLDVVFTNADYDMSIIAHVEPRDIHQWGNPDYYWRYDNPRVQELLELADTGTPEEQVTYLKEAAALLAEDAAASWLFLLPNLMVATPDVRGLPVNVVSEAFDLTTVSREPA